MRNSLCFVHLFLLSRQSGAIAESMPGNNGARTEPLRVKFGAKRQSRLIDRVDAKPYTMVMSQLTLALLGSFQLTRDGVLIDNFRSNKVRALLAYLAVEAGRPHTRVKLANLFWPDVGEATARTYLRHALANLRYLFGNGQNAPSFLITERESVQLTPTAQWSCDVDDLLAILSQALTVKGKLTHQEWAPKLQSALSLYRGAFLDGLALYDADPFDEWARLIRERLHRQVYAGWSALADDYLAAQNYTQALACSHRMVELEPTQEQGQQRLIRLLALTGQRTAALAQYDKCCQVLQKELGVEADAETKALYVAILSGAFSPVTIATPPPSSVQQRPVHLLTSTQGGNERTTQVPLAPTACLGRDQDVAAIVQLLQQHTGRLVSLVGPPGVGKTRLAIAVADQVQKQFSDGVYYVALAPVTNPDLVALALAGAFQLVVTPQTSVEQTLVAFLHDKELLLVLDNFEQIVAAAPLLADLLARCAKLRLLVTSRQRLYLRAEQCYPIAPLVLPTAVALFLQRAQAVEPNFTLTLNPSTQSVVEQICMELDCLPLAIELVAARIDLFSVQDLLTRLRQHRLDLLTEGLNDLPIKHRTLRNAIYASFGLLNQPEQQLFSVLGVFSGGFDLAAVESLGFRTETLRALVAKSMVTVLAQGTTEPRFLLLETLREYALEQLTQRGQLFHFQQQHTHYFLAFVEHLRPYDDSDTQKQWVAGIRRNYANIQAALQWALLHREVWTALRFVWPMRWYWWWTEQRLEAARWLKPIVALADDVGSAATLQEQGLEAHGTKEQYWDLTARALLALSENVGAGAEAEHFFQRSMTLAALTPPGELTIIQHQVLGGIQWGMKNYAKAEEEYNNTLQLASSLTNIDEQVRKNEIAWLLKLRSYVAFDCGDLERSAALAQQAYQLFMTYGNKLWAACSLAQLSRVALYAGDLPRAHELFAQSWQEIEQADDFTNGVVLMQHLAGLLALRSGDWTGASIQFIKAIKSLPHDSRGIGLLYDLYRILMGFIDIALEQQCSQIAAQLLGALHKMLDTNQWIIEPVYAQEHEAQRRRIDASLAQDDYTAAYKTGYAMAPEQVVDFLLTHFDK